MFVPTCLDLSLFLYGASSVTFNYDTENLISYSKRDLHCKGNSGIEIAKFVRTETSTCTEKCNRKLFKF